MQIECPSCGARGGFDESRLPPGGAFVRCPRCRHRILVEREGALAGASAVPSLPAADQAACSLCRTISPRQEMLRSGEQWVCAPCKPDFVQMLRQGLPRPGARRFGGFWIRFAAKFLDGLIQSMATGVILLPLMFWVGFSAATKAEPDNLILITVVQIVVQLGIPILYTVFFLGKYQSTPGKMACGLTVIRSDGGRITYGRAFGRYFSEILSSLTLMIGYLMAAFDEEKRALHDRVADTRVVFR